ncbi:MAG: HlyD family efflux transporter periplasmic adaptor subunit [Alphaproteobacteria bacterium]|nr:MAG: HlyD family efflux transporter periplasmic adaptor subunit [Alphaproteobacteria bacterium]
MKRRALLIVVAVIFAVSAAGLLWRGPLLSALGFSGESGRYLGYVEGETSLIAPPIAGRLVQRPVDRGVEVKKGDRLFVIDPVVAQAEVARTEGALAEARSRYENAESMMRQLRMRQSSLIAQEKVNELAARPDEIAAAKAQVDQDHANLDQAKKRLDDLMPGSPEDGLIENTFFNVGEWVPAGTPVVSLLPPFRVKLRFFVPQEDVARAQMGETVSFTCDSCPPDLKARIIYISPRSEFTPPVIYSQTARTKLVFLIEARPESTQTALPPGLPITVAPLAK